MPAFSTLRLTLLFRLRFFVVLMVPEPTEYEISFSSGILYLNKNNLK